jgi:hypothetical protein
MKTHISTLIIAILVLRGCEYKTSLWESDLPVVESFEVVRVIDESRFSHKLTYSLQYPEGTERISTYSPLLWTTGGKHFTLTELEPREKAKINSHHDGLHTQTVAYYDLTGLLSEEEINYIRIRVRGKNGVFKDVSIPIEE